MRKTSGNRNRQTGLQYTSLEERRLLAMLLVGGGGNDQVEVTHVDTNIVTVTINQTVKENLDISDGLRINLKGGNQDRVWIDHNITAEIGVFNAEELVLSGGDNFWQIGFVEDPVTDQIPTTAGSDQIVVVPSIGKPGRVAGRINSNITFLGTNSLRSGDGQDIYSVNTEELYGLNIYGGDGNDLFRFSAASNNLHLYYPGGLRRPSIAAYGQGGHDRFVIHGLARVTANGGADFDILDYRHSNYAANEFVGDVAMGEWANGNERIIGAPGQPNRFTSRSTGSVNYNFNWIIEANRTAVSDNAHDAFVELINFTDFHADPNGLDNFWVLETGNDIRINDADWIQISSEFQATEGNLDSINHDIAILKSLPIIPSASSNLVPDSSDFSISIIRDVDGVINPRVIISDATGNGSLATFGKNQTITRLTGGKISFGESNPFRITTAASARFLPEIFVHGSQTADDFFTFRHTWSPTSIYSHGGDDTFMFGSTNKDANGRLDRVDGEVHVFAGAGTDRMYLNDQGFLFGTARYNVADGLIQDRSSYPEIRGTNNLTIGGGQTQNPRFPDIHFDEEVEVTRINGSLEAPNEFDVAPSARTKFIFQGSEKPNDHLFVNGFLKERKLFEFNDNGAWTFGDEAENVFFFGIESVEDFRIFQSALDEVSPVILDLDPDAGGASNGGSVDSEDTKDGFQDIDNVFESI